MTVQRKKFLLENFEDSRSQNLTCV